MARAGGPGGPKGAEPRTPLQLVLDRSYGPFFGGRILATMGMWAHSITAAILVFQLTRSAFFVGLVSAAQFVPQYFLTVWSGARADRRDRRRLAVSGLLLASVGSTGLVVWLVGFGAEGTRGAMVVLVSSFVVGSGYAIASPPVQAVVPALVRPSELSRAIALNSLTVLIGRAVGPAVGALLIAAGFPAVGFGLNGAANLVYAVIVATTPMRPVERTRAADGSFLVALRYLRTDRALAAALVGIVAVGVGSDPVLTLTPAFAELLGAAPSFPGVMAAAFGAGSLLAFTVLLAGLRRYGTSGVGFTGVASLGVGMAGLSLSPTPLVAVVWLAFAGTGLTFGLTALTTLIQERVPEDLRGRTMAIWTVAWVGPRPLAAALSGAVADAVSVRVAIVLVAASVGLCAIAVRPSRTGAPLPDL